MEHNRVVYERPYDAEVEYLKSTGTQWIDTGVYGTSDTTIEFTSSFGVNSYNDSMNIGVVSWTNDEGKSLGLTYNATQKLFYIFLGTEYRTSRVIPELVSNTAYHFVVKQDGVWIDSQKIYDGYYSGSISTRYTIPFFANINQETGNLRYSNTGTIFYNLKIYDGTTLVRDFIPVRVGSVGYMYDRITRKLFGNKGTGNFILGPDIANTSPNIRRVFQFDNKRFVAISND